MSSPAEYLARVEQLIGGDVLEGVTLRLTWGTTAEAKAHIARIKLMLKELRLIKKQVSLDARLARSEYTDARARVGTGWGTALSMGLFGRRATGRFNAARRQDLRVDQLNAMAPYDAVRAAIDDVVVALERGQLQLEAWILENGRRPAPRVVESVAWSPEPDSIGPSASVEPSASTPTPRPTPSIGPDVGRCLEDEHFNPSNGNAEQRTTAHHGRGGLLVWRKADNWTAFTDGYWTWVNGPNGLQKRLNTERFDFEAPPAAAVAPAPVAAQPAADREVITSVAGQQATSPFADSPVRVTVREMTIARTLPEAPGPFTFSRRVPARAAQGKWVLVLADAEVVGNKAVCCLPGFRLKDSRNRFFTGWVNRADPQVDHASRSVYDVPRPSGDFQPNLPVRVVLVYDVPLDATGFSIQPRA